MGDYGLVNELIKFIWKYAQSNIFFDIHFIRKNDQSNKKMTHVYIFENKVLILVIQKSITMYFS
jgi:hypothetical protein